MKFYNREKELALLEKTRQIAFAQHSQMTVLTGRRRIGRRNRHARQGTRLQKRE